MSKLSKYNAVVPYVLIILGFALIYMTLINSRARSKQTNALIRVTACIISENATQRTQNDIEMCYRVVQQDTGVKLPRYDR